MVELLVVLCAITVLVAIALPTLSSIRKAGLQTECASNLRQIGAALELYNQAHRQLPDAADERELAAALSEGAGGDPRIFVCPADADARRFGYRLNPDFAGRPKSTGEPADELAREAAPRHGRQRNILFFDGHVALSN